MSSEQDPPKVDFSDLDRADSLKETYHALWPYLLEQVRVLQSDLAEETADRQTNYSEDSLRKTILPQIADKLTEADIITVEVPEDRRKQRKKMVYWELEEEYRVDEGENTAD
ncbi:hypothetical protein HT576_08865 [Haloterrigena sp. SYSU A121-1]|uniref:Uncharacterized protein n=1 Tax=Haloterrigena gelatinilytica TaxID=2741724 RepID=A0A8J8GK43_9EURY|nr:hypothetical protein [Haloterrigena gelatinilytica]NUB91131.1 hypothetical protein [Haloterrigena gelatinilytica]